VYLAGVEDRENKSFKKANNLAKSLAQEIRDSSWLNGIAIKRDKEVGFYVEVRTLPGFNPVIPLYRDGILIAVDTRETVFALRKEIDK
jgi:hypothetical protein